MSTGASEPGSAAAARVFITYRREETAAHAGRLYDAMVARFGEANVFMDVDMAPGDDFVERITEAVAACHVLIVVMGPKWATVEDEQGTPRLADPWDFVRLEVETALRRPDVTPIPVLVAGARMPNPHDLPPELRAITRRNALELSDQRWRYDVERLISTLDRLLPEGPTPPSPEDTSDRATVRASPAPRGPCAKSKCVELEHMLVRAARAGVVPAAPRDNRIFDIAPPPPEPEPEPEPAPGAATLPSWEARERVGAPPLRYARRPRRLWRALGFAALAAGVGYLIVDRLLGLVLEPLESRSAQIDEVVCTVFAPPTVTPGESFLVQTFVHLPEQANHARALALEMDTEAARRVFRSLEAPIPRGGRLHFELRAPGLVIDDPVTSLVWQGRPDAVQFGVSVPPGGVSGPVIATLSISLDSAPLGHVKFKTTVDSPSAASLPSAAGAEPEPQGELARRYRAAFISYASKDRDKVLQRVQMLPLVGVLYFQDLMNLDPGDRWLRRLELGIDECDLFLLFWSSEAKSSEWVRQEVRYALERRGGDDLALPEIKPVIIEGPPVVEPWEELAHLHFNDRVLYFMNR